MAPGRKRPTASWEHPSLVPQGASGKVGLRLAGAGDISPQAATRIGGAEAARSPPPPPQVVRGGPGGESDLFSLQPAHPHPFQGWDFILRPVPPGLSHLLRRTQNLAEARGDEPFREQGRDGSVPAPSAGRSAGMSVGAPGVSAGWLAPQGGFPVGRKETSRRQEQLQARTPLRRRGGCARGGAARGDGAAADAGPREPRAPAEGRWAPRARSIRGRLPAPVTPRTAFPRRPAPGAQSEGKGPGRGRGRPQPESRLAAAAVHPGSIFDGGGGCLPVCPRSRLPLAANQSSPSPRARRDWGRVSSAPRYPVRVPPARARGGVSCPPRPPTPRGSGAAASLQRRGEM